MTYKSFVSAAGDRATIEIRLLVLTSQHEDSLFRVKVAVTSQQEQTFEVISEPIRVVSKPSQVHKKRRTGASTVEITAPPTPTVTCGSKRSAPSNQDSVLEALQRMEDQQLEQRKLIEQLLLQQQTSSSSPKTFSFIDDGDFISAFQTFLNAYNKIPIEERPNKLRKAVLSNQTASDSLADFVSVCVTPEHHLLGDSTMKSITSRLGCDGECEHKKQLETFGDLYTELTWSPDSSELPTTQEKTKRTKIQNHKKNQQLNAKEKRQDSSSA